jgi:hypothetical protein
LIQLFFMKLTPFGFVNCSEEFVKDALSLPPIGGGKWSTRRVANLMDHSSALHVLVTPEGGSEKTTMIMHARLTGGARDGGIQGWADYPGTGEREAFIIRQTDADRALEEIFDIVEKNLSRVPEWDHSALPSRPEPPARVFEPLIPEVQKSEPAAEADSGAFDPQAMIDAMLSPDSFEAPPESPTENPAPEPVVAEANPEPVAEEVLPEPIAEDTAKAAPKAAKGKKAKG